MAEVTKQNSGTGAAAASPAVAGEGPPAPVAPSAEDSVFAKRTHLRPGVVCGLLLLAVLAVFGQTLWHGFVNYDDPDYVFDNTHVRRGLSGEAVAWAFTAFHASNWHPLAWLSHMLDCQLYGLRPGGHHLTNVLLHAAAAIVLFLALRKMTRAPWASAWVAAVFAIHPLRVESVAWVAERKDVLSGLFFMLTLWAYALYAERPGCWRRYGVVVAAFALGLAAKPMLVTLPFVLLLLDYWPLRRLAVTPPDAVWRPALRLVMEKIPLFVVAGAVVMLTVAAQRESISSLDQLDFPRRLENALEAYVAYLGQMIVPVGLAPLYPLSKESPPAWLVLGALLLLAGISAMAVKLRKRHPYLLVGWLWYLGTLVPVIGLMQVGVQKMADRYTYLTQIGLYLAIAWAGVDAVRRWPAWRRPLAAFAVLSVALLMAGAWRQTRFWRDSVTLWNHTLACTERNAAARYNLGVALMDRGEVDAAIAQLQEALAIRPQYAEAWYNVGMALKQQGRPREAFASYQKALEFKPDFAEAWMNLGNLLADQRQLDAAVAHYEKALQFKPDNAEAENNLGTALGGRGQRDEAIAHYRRALKLKPDYIDAHNNLGAALAGSGRLDDAIASFRESLRLNPEHAITRFNLGIALARRGDTAEARGHYQKAFDLAIAANDRALADAIRARMQALGR